MTLRDAIVSRAGELGWTVHRLAREVDGVSQAQLYRYFAGTSELTSAKVDRLLAVLGLRVGRGKRGAFVPRVCPVCSTCR